MVVLAIPFLLYGLFLFLFVSANGIIAIY